MIAISELTSYISALYMEGVVSVFMKAHCCRKLFCMCKEMKIRLQWTETFTLLFFSYGTGVT